MEIKNIATSGVQGTCSYKELEVRLIEPFEKTRWTELMAKHHYLDFKRLIGEALHYVVTIDGEWVALIGWASAALYCTAREQWLGWSSQFRSQRLYLIANNVRFLILPWIRIKNLASKILSLNLRRLSDDWIRYHGHPILLVETFVDPNSFRGTCYKASNWAYVGKTQGFRKSAKQYIYHGDSKLVFIKTLEKNAKNYLTQVLLAPHLKGKCMSVKFTSKQLDMLNQTLRALPDNRSPRGVRHSYRAIIAISICAVISGAKSYIEIGEWASACTQNQLKRFRTFYDRTTKKFVAPSESCLRRTLQNSDAQAIDFLLGDWLYAISFGDEKALAVDGKVLKGAKDKQGQQTQLLSVFLHTQGVVLNQIAIDNKTNEIPELPRLLEHINIEGKVITADALHTQTETANYLVKKNRILCSP